MAANVILVPIVRGEGGGRVMAMLCSGVVVVGVGGIRAVGYWFVLNSLLDEDVEGVDISPSVPCWGNVVSLSFRLFAIFPISNPSCVREIVCVVSC